MKTGNILIVVNLLAFTGLIYGEPNDFKPVSSNDVNYVLNMIASHIQENYNHINTWEGEIEYTNNTWYSGASAENEFHKCKNSKGETPNDAKKTSISKRTFLIDSKKDNLLIQYIPIGQTFLLDVNSNHSYEYTENRLEETIITKPEYQIEVMPLRYRDDSNEITQRIGIKRPGSGNLMVDMMRAHDPRTALRNIGMPVWSWLEYLVQNGLIRQDASIGIKERFRDGFIDYRIDYSVETPVPVDGSAVKVYSIIFSGNSDFHIVSHETKDKDGNILAKQTTDFTLIDGIYLPAHIHLIEYAENGKVKMEETHVFKNMRVNKIIPEDSFTYKNAGLKNGDIVKEEITDKKYIYQDANLVPIAEANNPPK
jgi:hypothetical protein